MSKSRKRKTGTQVGIYKREMLPISRNVSLDRFGDGGPERAREEAEVDDGLLFGGVGSAGASASGSSSQFLMPMPHLLHSVLGLLAGRKRDRAAGHRVQSQRGAAIAIRSPSADGLCWHRREKQRAGRGIFNENEKPQHVLMFHIVFYFSDLLRSHYPGPKNELVRSPANLNSSLPGLSPHFASWPSM